jgi:hypothetical protein
MCWGAASSSLQESVSQSEVLQASSTKPYCTQAASSSQQQQQQQQRPAAAEASSSQQQQQQQQKELPQSSTTFRAVCPSGASAHLLTFSFKFIHSK